MCYVNIGLHNNTVKNIITYNYALIALRADFKDLQHNTGHHRRNIEVRACGVLTWVREEMNLLQYLLLQPHAHNPGNDNCSNACPVSPTS